MSNLGQSDQPNEPTDPLGSAQNSSAGPAISANSVTQPTSTTSADSGTPASSISSASQPKGSLASLQDKGLSLIKVFAYVFICFASTVPPLDQLVRYAYFHIHNQALFYFSVSALDCFLALVMLYVFARFLDKKPFLSYGFKGCTIGGGIKEGMAGAAVAALMVSIVMLILFLTGSYQILSAAWNIQFLAFLPFFLAAAMREEVIFRGYVLQTLERSWGTTSAIVISSLMFGFLHLINFEAGVELPAKLYSCMCLSIDAGLVFAVAYLVKRRLWFPFGLHVAWNVFEGPIYGTLISSLVLGKPLVVARLTGPVYLTGGIFGPEASLVEVCMCLLLVALMWRRAMPSQIIEETN